ncbi:hypothetical protein HanHA300_Chr09g0341261 [Helianthus annuus]|nr:hypothetical protein HanHA300_Chr09g0341261 [Helianthus annuus]KAJ0544518.1 hypothetical protein HanHA89_Chr09g0362551 [Helianthus annuus]KAJ0709520.1 hypothetical protein HanLR1_Chr09g0341291 [Helianthus annuus]KAJ0713393.1 hypothetical protein HanOQP8_Chr09g0345381 [Helianthus annuus]
MLLSDMSGTHTRWKIDPSSLSIFSDLFTQQLASRLVIDGITPPSWLLSPNSNSHSSYLNDWVVFGRQRTCSDFQRREENSEKWLLHR